MCGQCGMLPTYPKGFIMLKGELPAYNFQTVLKLESMPWALPMGLGKTPKTPFLEHISSKAMLGD